MPPRVLISDALSESAVEIFTRRGVAADYRPELGRDKDALLKAIGDFDGLAIRSTTKVTEKLIAAADRLTVIGRAGIGIDNVDLAKATARGIVVMNTPFGNSITTAEHAIAMIFAVARRLPAADASTQDGKWEKSRFLGTELTGKTLGIIGCGNIGSVVADRGIGLKMRVIAFDPFLSNERAIEIGVEKVELDELLLRADIVSLHAPLTDRTRGIIDAGALTAMRRDAILINCARGGLVVEEDLAEALKTGEIAGAGIDVFSAEPANESVLFGLPNIVCTPHLGASTSEAQENVAIQIAEQMSDYLIDGAVANALNMPSITSEEAPRLAPFVTLADQLGLFAGQLTETGIQSIRLEYEGIAAELNTRALTATALTGVLKPVLQSVNMVSALALARERGIHIEEVRREQKGAYEGYIRLTITTDRRERSVAGTVFSGGRPRIIQIKGINMEAELAPNMLYVTNLDRPGFIGRLGTALGEEGVNISTFNLGRSSEGEDAIALIGVDQELTDAVIDKVAAVEGVVRAKRLRF